MLRFPWLPRPRCLRASSLAHLPTPVRWPSGRWGTAVVPSLERSLDLEPAEGALSPHRRNHNWDQKRILHPVEVLRTDGQKSSLLWWQSVPATPAPLERAAPAPSNHGIHRAPGAPPASRASPGGTCACSAPRRPPLTAALRSIAGVPETSLVHFRPTGLTGSVFSGISSSARSCGPGLSPTLLHKLAATPDPASPQLPDAHSGLGTVTTPWAARHRSGPSL